MAITLRCQGCGKVLRLKDEAAGKRGKCPGCGQAFAVPLQGAVAEEVKPKSSDAAAPLAPKEEAARGSPTVQPRQWWKVISGVFILLVGTVFLMFTSFLFFEAIGLVNYVGPWIIPAYAVPVMLLGKPLESRWLKKDMKRIGWKGLGHWEWWALVFWLGPLTDFLPGLIIFAGWRAFNDGWGGRGASPSGQ